MFFVKTLKMFTLLFCVFAAFSPEAKPSERKPTPKHSGAPTFHWEVEGSGTIGGRGEVTAVPPPPTGSEVVVRSIANQILAAQSLSDVQAAAALAQSLSIEERAQVLGLLGGAFGNDYDFAEDNGGRTVPGPSLMQLIQAYQQHKPAGVCRDIALAINQIAQMEGLNAAYTVGYASIYGSHADMLFVDPTDKKKVYVVNYGSVAANTSNNPASAMGQNTNMPGVGITEQIYTPDGKMVGQYATNFGVLMQQMAHQPISVLDPLTYSYNSYLTATGRIAPGISAIVGGGQTADGNRVAVVGGKIEAKSGDSSAFRNHAYFKGSTSLLAFHEDQPNPDPFFSKITASGAYASLGAEFGTPALQIGNTHTRAIFDWNQQIMYGVFNGSPLGRASTFQHNPDTATEFSAGLQSGYCSNDGRTSIVATAVLTAGASEDLHEVNSAVHAYLTHEDLSVHAEHSLDSFDLAHAKRSLAFDTTLVHREGGLGTDLAVQGGLSWHLTNDKELLAELGFEGPVSGGQNPFVPGGENAVTFGASIRSAQRYSLGVQGICDVTGKKKCSVGAKADYKF